MAGQVSCAHIWGPAGRILRRVDERARKVQGGKIKGLVRVTEVTKSRRENYGGETTNELNLTPYIF